MIKEIPKIELHCHLDGSVRVDTIIDIAKKENINLPTTNYDEVKTLVQAPQDCRSLNEYLKRFDIPNMVMQSKESLKRITFELLEDAAKENIKYMEIRFAPQLHTQKGLSYSEIIESVIEGIEKAEELYEIKGNIILSCMRLEAFKDGLEIVEVGKEYLGNKVVAIDLAGPEEEGFAMKYKDIIDKAREYGFRVTIHAGEAASGQNVIDAINILGAERIGHGLKIEGIKEACNLVKDKSVVLEMCPTSNVQTKNVESYEKYPLYKFYKDGIKVSFNTDNRTVSNIDLTNEIEVIFNRFDIDLEDLKEIYLNTVEASFADDDTRNWLRKFV